MTLRLTEADDRLQTERARSENRSKQEVARAAVHSYLTDQVRPTTSCWRGESLGVAIDSDVYQIL